jgi:hypothetical protein
MLRRIVEVAPVAALLAIATPQPSAQAMGVPTLQSDEAIVLVGEDLRRGKGKGSRSERSGRDDGPRIHRGDDDRRRFRREDGREAGEFRRHRRRDNRDRWFSFGFGPRYYDDVGCEWLRRRALATDSAYWSRRYRACVRGL